MNDFTGENKNIISDFTVFFFRPNNEITHLARVKFKVVFCQEFFSPVAPVILLKNYSIFDDHVIAFFF